jgi:hypothetical protein
MKYRIKKRFNIYNGEMYEVQIKMFGFIWGPVFNDWFKDKKTVYKIVNRLNKKIPIGNLIDNLLKREQTFNMGL